jgi:hypothetical protein
MDRQAMACVAWSCDGRVASWTSLGRDLVDWKCPVLEKDSALGKTCCHFAFANRGFPVNFTKQIQPFPLNSHSGHQGRFQHGAAAISEQEVDAFD